MKRVLFIAYSFPPAGGGGVQRTTKFVKYLPQTGWKPVVITVKNPLYFLRDETLSREIPPAIEIIKVREWLPNNLLLSVRAWIRRRLGDANGEPAPTAGGGDGEYSSESKADSSGSKADTGATGPGALLSRLFRALFRTLNDWVIPDMQISWALTALIPALRLVRRGQVDVVYATAPPASSFVTAYLLHKLTGIPYVVDFRDAWTLNPIFAHKPTLRFERWLEKRILKNAAHAIFATRIMQADYEQLHPDFKDKFSTITNGYDEADFQSLEPRPLPPINIVYMGRVTQKLRLDNFLLGLRQALDRHPHLQPHVHLTFVGFVFGDYDAEIERLGLRDHVTYAGYLPHRQALQYALGADILLLLGSGDLAEMTGKIFEYLRAARPIFAVAPHGGEAAQLIERTGHGIVAQYDDIDEIAAKLANLLLAIHEDRHSPLTPSPLVPQLDRRHQTQSLATILNRINHPPIAP